jgi:uncharacterized coiled-coil protein SlyX
MASADDRATALEIALTHQQAMLDDLSAVLLGQDRRIARLEKQIEGLAGRLAAAEDAPAEGGGAADRPPPHW